MVFCLDVGTDLFGMKQNTKLEFASVPQLSELIIAGEAHFDKEARLRRPAGVPDAPFKVQSSQVYDDVLLRWVDLYSSTQLHTGSQVWLFQPASLFNSEAPGDIPAAKYSPESWLGSPARARAVTDAGIRDPVMSEKLRSVFYQFDPDRRREISYTTLQDYFTKYDIPWTSSYIGDYYSRSGVMTYADWVSFAGKYPSVVDSLYYRTRGLYNDRPYYSASLAAADLAAARVKRESELRTYYTAYAAEKARIEADYSVRRAAADAAAATAAASAYYYAPYSPRYL